MSDCIFKHDPPRQDCSQCVSSTTSKPVEELKVIEYPDGFRFGNGDDIIVSSEILHEYIQKQVLEGRIELLLRVKSELPDDDTNCMADHMDGDGCEPKDHWRRDGRFFMSMETNEYISDLIEELKEVRNSSAQNKDALQTNNKEEEV